MTAVDGVLTTGLVVAFGVIVVAMCGQGRLRHWILIALGVVPREAAPGVFDDIPRKEREWARITQLDAVDAPERHRDTP